MNSRYEFGTMLMSMGLHGEAAEIGVAEGGFSFDLLGKWAGILHMIDCWEHLDTGYQDGCNVPTDSQEWRYAHVCKIAKQYGGRAVVHRAFSLDAVKLFKPGQLDFCYIDSNHALPAIRADLISWYPIVKPGGVFAGHDYLDGMVGGSEYGVKQAVTEFAAANGLNVEVIAEQWPSWFIRKPL